MHTAHFVRSVGLEQVGINIMTRKVTLFALITSIIIVLFGCQEASQVTQSWTHSTDGAFDADLDHEGKHALVATKDNGTQYWDLDNNQLKFIFSHEESEKTPHRLVKIAKRAPVAVTLDDTTIGVWDLQSGKSLAYWQLASPPRDVDLSKDGRFALIGFMNNEARLIDLTTGLSWKTFKHADQINSVALSNNEQYALVGSDDTAVRLWDLNKGTLKHQWFMPFKVGFVAISPDDKYVLISSAQHVSQIFKLEDGSLVSELQLTKFDLPLWRKPLLTIISATFKGDKLYTGSPPRHIRQWDIKSGKLEKHWLIPKPKNVRYFAAVPLSVRINDENDLVSQSTDGKGYVFEMQ